MSLELSDDAMPAAAPDWLDRLRRTAEEAGRGHDWPTLHAMTEELRGDGALWADLWAPLCAVAARHVGDSGARSLLEEAITGGFNQPEHLAPELADAFDGDPDWSELLARIERNVAPVPLVLTDWPTITPTVPLTLFRIEPEREGLLRDRLPAPAETAWETALALLAWVTKRWRHANSHMDVDDAVKCLDRVDQGERFACVEYSLVLSQALNAVGIPARRLSLRQPGYHAGNGRGHVVSEAWIDDLARWVVLDGQNGLYWTGSDGAPMGALELQAYADNQEADNPESPDADGPDGVPAPGVPPKPDDVLRFWLSYFASISTTGVTWSAGEYVPIFQKTGLNTTPRLHRDGRQAYPDLSELAIGLEIVDRQCAIRLTTEHPYAEGFVVRQPGGHNQLPLDAPVWVLDPSPGPHQVELAVRTRYGTGVTKVLRYAMRG